MFAPFWLDVRGFAVVFVMVLVPVMLVLRQLLEEGEREAIEHGWLSVSVRILDEDYQNLILFRKNTYVVLLARWKPVDCSRKSLNDILSRLLCLNVWLPGLKAAKFNHAMMFSKPTDSFLLGNCFEAVMTVANKDRPIRD